MLAFGTARAEEGLRRREAFFTAVARAEAAVAEAAANRPQADPLGLAATPIDQDPLDLAKWGSQSLGTAGPQLCLQPRKKRSVPPAKLKVREGRVTERQKKREASATRQRGASGSRPVALLPSAAHERRREIMKNVAGGLPVTSLIPASKRNLGSGGRNNPETAATEYVGEVRFQHVPVPTAFTERYGEVDKVADKPNFDLTSKLLNMTLEDNPNLIVPLASEQLAPPPAAPRTGTTAVDLEDSDSSSAKSVHSSSSSSSTSDAAVPSEDPSAVAAVAALELARAVTRAEPAAVATVAALKQAKAAQAEPAAVATVASLEQARAAARAATAQMQELD